MPHATSSSAHLTAVAELSSSMERHELVGFQVAVVLGSGLGAFAEALSGARAVGFDALEGMPRSRIPGHAGRFVLGEIGGVRVLVQQGRAHLYEGHSPHEATRAIRAFARLGCRAVVLTNAAGGLRREWKPGTLARITDHVNLQGRSAVLMSERSSGEIYSPRLGAALDRAASTAGIELERGVYAGLLGPSYETPAEIRMLRALGVDLVGMSTVAEASAACASGMQVAALSLVTNPAAGIGQGKLDHAEVLAAGAAAAERITKLLLAAVPEIAPRARD